METKKNIIDLKKNRDFNRVWLEEVEPNTNKYKLCCDAEWALNYACVNFEYIPEDSTEYDAIYSDKKCKIISVDPSGGPYLSVDSKIDNKVIKNIQDTMDGFILTIE